MKEYTFKEYYSGRKHWAVYSPDGQMLCVCLYKKGAACLPAHLNKLTKEIDNDNHRTTDNGNNMSQSSKDCRRIEKNR